MEKVDQSLPFLQVKSLLQLSNAMTPYELQTFIRSVNGGALVLEGGSLWVGN